MPRSRRRHHSRSRSRSRSHSHERDREAKRRKIDSVESPTHKRSVSEPENEDHIEDIQDEIIEADANNKDENNVKDLESSKSEQEYQDSNQQKQEENVNDLNEEQKHDEQELSSKQTNEKLEEIKEKTLITPSKSLSPKQLQKKLESEKRRQQKLKEKEEREKEKEKLRLEKLKEKQEKEDQKKKERELKEKEKQIKEEQKKKEREEKEQKRKEKEEQRKKEKEQEKLKKQQEIDEKYKEKQKLEEQKQKAAVAFKSFFKKSEPNATVESKKPLMVCSVFMPFQVKTDMRLAPSNRRSKLSEEEKETLDNYLINPKEALYLTELKNGKIIGKCNETWPYEDIVDDDLIIVEGKEFGETICEDKPKIKMRAKYLSFHENRRPPYYGTFRKKSNFVKPRRPFAEDKDTFDYEVDSDDDWEEEEQGELLDAFDDEEKEDGVEEEDYEVDNEFFVPHGHLSDDEIDEEADAKLSPESHKAKLKLLKAEFDEDRQHKTHKLKARSIGCIWYNKDGSNVEEAIDKYLKPLSIITNGQIVIKKRCNHPASVVKNKIFKELDNELIPKFLKIINGNTNNKKTIIEEFLTYLTNNGWNVSKASLHRFLRSNAQWKKCTEEGPMFNKLCWCINDNVKDKLKD